MKIPLYVSAPSFGTSTGASKDDSCRLRPPKLPRQQQNAFDMFEHTRHRNCRGSLYGQAEVQVQAAAAAVVRVF